MKKLTLKKVSSPFFLIGLLLSSGLILFIPAANAIGGLPPASSSNSTGPIQNKAAVDASWIDHSHINIQTKINGAATDGVYYDDKTDSNLSYVGPVADSSGNCKQPSVIDSFDNLGSSGGNPKIALEQGIAVLHYWLPASSTNQNCFEHTSPVNFSKGSADNFNDYFIWVDSGTIQSTDGTALVFTQQSSGGTTYVDSSPVSPTNRSGDASCYSQITADPSAVTAQGTTTGQLIINSSGNVGPGATESSDGPLGGGWAPNIENATLSSSNGCSSNSGDPVSIAIADPQITVNGNKAPASQQAAGSGNLVNGGTNSSGGSTAPSLNCDVTFNPLTWLLCPAVQGMVSIVDDLDNVITSQLDIGNSSSCTTTTDQPCQIFDKNTVTGKGYYTAWSSFRDIALGLMVVVGLIILISQALGFEFLDAYTIRRALPRLITAAVVITLSWPLMQFMVTLTNDLGFGIRHLIYQPFESAGINQINLNGGGLAAGNLVASVAIVALGIFGLLSFAATAALAVFVAFLVLILRQLVIIVAIIVSPIAIVAYILPNTQNIFKIWWESFSKALLMFPLIAAFIAAGRVFAAVSTANSSGAGGVGSTLGSLMGFAAYFVPYFLLPATFKLAGGALRQIGGFVNDRHRGGFDRLRQYRGNQTKHNAARLKAGTRFEGSIPGTTRLSNYANEVSKGLGTGWKGRYGIGRRGAEARGYVDQIAAGELGNDPKMKAIKGKNDYNRILAMGNGSEAQGRKMLAEHLREERGDDGRQLHSEAEISQRVDAAARAAKAAGAFTKAHAIAAFRNMAQDGTAIRDTDDLARLAAIVGNGNGNNTYSFAAEAASISRQVGRSDLAAASEPIGALANAHSDLIYNNGLYHDEHGRTAAQAMDDLKMEAEFSGGGGEVAWTKFGNAKARTIRNDTRNAVDYLKKYQAAVRSGNASEVAKFDEGNVQKAAAILMEGQMAVAQGYGKINNREVFNQEIDKDGGALQWYLDQPMGGVGRGVPGETKPQRNSDGTIRMNADGQIMYESKLEEQSANRDAVLRLVGQRQGSMSEEQRRSFGGGPGGPGPGIGGAGGGGSAGGGPAGTAGGGGGPSDRRLKRNISVLSVSPNGIRLYKFQYLWSDQVYVGVMAQDLIHSHPEALKIYDDGFYRVDYSKLGLRMMTIEEWNQIMAVTEDSVL